MSGVFVCLISPSHYVSIKMIEYMLWWSFLLIVWVNILIFCVLPTTEETMVTKYYMELALKQSISLVLDEFPISFFSGIYYIQIYNTNYQKKHTLLSQYSCCHHLLNNNLSFLTAPHLRDSPVTSSLTASKPCLLL